MIKNSSTVQRKNIRTLQYLPLRKYSQIFKSHSGNCTSSLNLIFFSPETLQKHVEKSHGYLIWDTLMLSLKTIYKDLTHMQLWSGGVQEGRRARLLGGSREPFQKENQILQGPTAFPTPPGYKYKQIYIYRATISGNFLFIQMKNL